MNVAILLAFALAVAAAVPVDATGACRRDCNGDGDVDAAELRAAIDVALTSQGAACSAFPQVGPLTIEHLVAAVDDSVRGCPTDPCTRPPLSAFDDHTQPCLADRADFFALAVESNGRSVVKFVITDFRNRRLRAMRWYDGAFYTLHDEWYWFRLLNGERVPGETVAPVQGLRFDSIAEIYAWAAARPVLPLDLQFGDGRLFSLRFYRLGLEDPRQFGLGSLVHIAAREGPVPRPERWLFEIEYVDVITYPQLVLFFETLAATLPPEISANAGWLVRSPAQEQLARQIEAAGLPYHDRLVRFADLVVPGETEVYSPGLTAGRLRLVALSQGPLPALDEGDILVLDQIPDSLPLVAGLITGVPQTPLAHVNLLARSRRIPNAYRGGVLEEAFVRDLAQFRAPVALRARLPDELDLVPLTESEYATWRQLRQPPPSRVDGVDLSSAPYTIDLRQLSLADVDELRPLIGGKSAGFLALLAVDDVTTPDAPLAVTIRPYAEHIQPLRPAIEAMLADADFAASARVRTLVLEGPEAYDERYPPASDQGVRDRFFATHPPGNPAGDLARAGGLKAAIVALPMAPSTLALLRAALEQQFDAFAVTQALRFRSSSTVEDIEGFVGAGLYTSNSGFLDAAAQPRPRDRDRTVELALKQTWSSYWNVGAFEERRSARIDHLSGNMGVTVHARFDDDQELANAVLTFAILPAGEPASGVMEVNVQKGAVSVTNPEGGSTVLPEVDRVTKLRHGSELAIERVRPSTIVPAGEKVLSDEQLRSLFSQTEQVAAAWLAQANAELPAERAATTLLLDFELRFMDAGWPALATGPAYPARLILKQARSLDPGLRSVPAALRQADIPRDVLAHAGRVEERACSTPAFVVTALEVYTDALIPPDLGYDVEPFTAVLAIDFTADIPELGFDAGDRIRVTHLDFAAVAHPGPASGAAWDVDVELEPATAMAVRLDRLYVSARGPYRLEHEGARLEGLDASCTVEVLHASPEEYLASRIDGN